jgi:hypothetical protein
MSTRRLKMKAMDAALTAGVKIDNVERFCREHGVTTRTHTWVARPKDIQHH